MLAFCWGVLAEEPVESAGSVTVWAAGDGARVNPETGRYFEDRTDVHADYPTGDYQSRNAIWDADEARIVLHAARNEFVPFQIIVDSEHPISGANLRVGSLRGPDGATISGRNVASSKAWYLHVAKPSSGYQQSTLGPGWYPDALLPSEEDGAISFDIPDEQNAIGRTQRNQSIWIDVYVPPDRDDAPPGPYRGRLTVSWPGGRRELRVELRVWDFALPDRIHCQGDIWNGSLRRMEPDLELRYYQMARRHRFLPGVAGYRPKLEIDGTSVTIDWDAYDRRLGRYLDGSAFTGANGYWGPGYGIPIDHILLPFDVNWPVVIPEKGPVARAETIWKETARQFKAHFDSDPRWRNVKKIVFIGGLDESYSEAAYKRMIYYCQLLRQGMGQGWFQYRIDGGYSREAMETLHNYVDLWVCHTAGYDAKKIMHFKQKGVEPWFYGPMIYERRGNSACGSNTFTDLDLLTCRGVGWAAWKHRSGYCQWEFDAFYDEKSRVFRPENAGDRAWKEAVNCRYGNSQYNGSGLLIYRGQPMGLSGPVPSIRLKALRRGLQDYEYFWLLRQAGQGSEADQLVDGIVHTLPFGPASMGNTEIWKNDPEAWEAARTRAGTLLARPKAPSPDR
jgi:hypothetical protein